MNNNDIFPWDQTPNLAGECDPVPKPEPKAKKTKTRIKAAIRSMVWKEGHPELKQIFQSHNITSCEIKLDGCLGDQYLGFAHVQRRVNYTPEELIDPHKVVVADQQCHDIVDHQMKKKEAEKLLQAIVDGRGW